MKTSARALFLALSLLAALPVRAEKADRDKPVNIEADRVTVDDVKKIHTFEGRVTLTQGTTMIRGDKIVVTQDLEGFQKGVATGNLAYFRTKRDGREEYVEGQAERIEHDDRTDTTQFFNRAWVKSGEDEVRGQYIQYDGRSEQYLVTNGPGGTVQSGRDSRVRAVIQPKSKDGAARQPAPATPPGGAAPPLKAAPAIANPREE